MVTKEKDRNELLRELREKREKKRQKKLRAKMRRRVFVPIALITAVCVTLGIVYSVSAKEITITEINEFTGLKSSQKVVTTGGNVEEVLRDRGLYVGEDDRLNVPPDKQVCDNDDIILTRGKRVTIKVGDTESVATVTKADAADALVEAGYTPGVYDSITTVYVNIRLRFLAAARFNGDLVIAVRNFDLFYNAVFFVGFDLCHIKGLTVKLSVSMRARYREHSRERYCGNN